MHYLSIIERRHAQLQAEADALSAARRVRLDRISRGAARLATLEQLTDPTREQRREMASIGLELVECREELHTIDLDERRRRQPCGLPALSPGAPRMLSRRPDGTQVVLEAIRP